MQPNIKRQKKITQAILESQWVYQYGYLFAKTEHSGDEMIADHDEYSIEETALAEMIDQSMFAHMDIPANLQDSAEAFARILARNLLSDSGPPIFRIRGWGGGMDQKRVLDHICNMQKEHIDATTVGRLISEVRQDIKDEILQEKQLKDHLLYEKGDPLLDNLDSEG